VLVDVTGDVVFGLLVGVPDMELVGVVLGALVVDGVAGIRVRVDVRVVVASAGGIGRLAVSGVTIVARVVAVVDVIDVIAVIAVIDVVLVVVRVVVRVDVLGSHAPAGSARLLDTLVGDVLKTAVGVHRVDVIDVIDVLDVRAVMLGRVDVVMAVSVNPVRDPERAHGHQQDQDRREGGHARAVPRAGSGAGVVLDTALAEVARVRHGSAPWVGFWFGSEKGLVPLPRTTPEPTARYTTPNRKAR